MTGRERPSGERPALPPAGTPPHVSVVMPVRDEEATIERSVRSVLRQEYPADRLEVVVAIGPSHDRTRAVVAELAGEDDRVRVIDNEEGSVPHGFNLALKAARGSLIARVDGHCWVEERFISSAVDILARTGADGVGGVVTHVGVGSFGRAVALAMTSRLGAGNATFRIGAARECDADTLAFGVYPRSVFERVGGYDEELLRNQDDEWHHRVRLAGGRLVLNPGLRSSYIVRSSLSRLRRQYADYGRFRVATLVKHRRPGAARQLAPPALVLGLAAGLATDALSGGRRRTGRTLVSAYAAALAVEGCAAAARARRPRLGPLVAVALGTMHLAYGAGFWIEVANRLARQQRRTSPAPSG